MRTPHPYPPSRALAVSFKGRDWGEMVPRDAEGVRWGVGLVCHIAETLASVSPSLPPGAKKPTHSTIESLEGHRNLSQRPACSLTPGTDAAHSTESQPHPLVSFLWKVYGVQ